MTGDGVPELWAARAAVAEVAIVGRHLRQVWGTPGTRLGMTRWPPETGHRLHAHWHYGWQAQLLDCAVDAAERTDDTARKATVVKLVRGIRLRNPHGWVSGRHDELALMGLALLRARKLTAMPKSTALVAIASRLRAAWTDHAGGGLWSERGGSVKDAATNAAFAILFTGLAEELGDRADLQRARSAVEWLAERLIDPETGLLAESVDTTDDAVSEVTSTHSQGLLVGACVALAGATGEGRWRELAERTITAVSDHLTNSGVLRGNGGSDSGLHAGICARHLAGAAIALDGAAAKTAASIVYRSAEGAWRNRAAVPGGPLFGPQWTVPAVGRLGPLPARLAEQLEGIGRDSRWECDLSVQVSGWTAVEAAARLARHGVPEREFRAVRRGI
ncbi:AGE family epimerase/isomerase [Allokutzneria sp. A3M-2-11 16]|uniref:glycoside hydrolase family 76 protein n=1 Tax=Allokutzneria sp. A3M-2-11 16 TaxID=2962043 RepID=UPI0020B651D9|nr:glycoside hydrolase family 76 protein [Allokutzneria sp. A3M-2-11 16]MCP3799267.1 AGE family epimerase/isomerase [Allokutzneria sp. A3M-2-11 16]